METCPDRPRWLTELSALYGTSLMFETGEAGAGFETLELDRVRVPGRAGPVAIHAAVTPGAAFAAWRVIHNAMLAAYRAGDMSCAAQELAAARRVSEDMLGLYYDAMGERIAQLIARPPGEDWDGTLDVDQLLGKAG